MKRRKESAGSWNSGRLSRLLLGAMLLLVARSAYAGWPFEFGDIVNWCHPLEADVDMDGKGDIVIATKDSMLHAIDRNGNEINGWPVNCYDAGWSSPAVGDLDGDGIPEVVMASTSPKIYVFSNSGQLLWTKDCGGLSFYGIPTLADLDSDGTLEVIAIARMSPLVGTSRLYVIRHDGSDMAPWPQVVPLGGASYAYSVVAVDGDTDGQLEIVVGMHGVLLVYEVNGSIAQGWPFTMSYQEALYGSPIVGDVDNDGAVEIVLGTTYLDPYAFTGTGRVRVFRWDGTLEPNWPQDFDGHIQSTPAIADLDHNGDLELIFGTVYSQAGNAIYVCNHDGSLFLASPIATGTHGPSLATPVVADLDNDGDPEIAVGLCNLEPPYAGGFGIWHHDGTPFAGYPLWYGAGNPVGSPVAAKLHTRVFVDIYQAHGSQLDWMGFGAPAIVQPQPSCRMFHHDARRTGSWK